MQHHIGSGDTLSYGASDKAKLEMEEGDSKSTLTFRDCQMKAELEGKVYDQDGLIVNLSGRGQATQSRDLWEAAGTLSVAANNLGGAKLNMEVSGLDKPMLRLVHDR